MRLLAFKLSNLNVLKTFFNIKTRGEKSTTPPKQHFSLKKKKASSHKANISVVCLFLLQALCWPWRCREAWIQRPLWGSSSRLWLRKRSSSSECLKLKQRWRLLPVNSPCLACLSCRDTDGFLTEDCNKMNANFCGVFFCLYISLCIPKSAKSRYFITTSQQI